MNKQTDHLLTILLKDLWNRIKDDEFIEVVQAVTTVIDFLEE